MAILKSKSSVYEFSLDMMRELIAADLDCDVEDLIVEYVIREVGSDYFERGSRFGVIHVQVTRFHKD